MYSISIIGWNKNKGIIKSAKTMYCRYIPECEIILFSEDRASADKFESPEIAKKWGEVMVKDLIKQFELNGSEITIRHDYNIIPPYIFEDMVYDISSMVIVDDETDLAYDCPIPQEYLLSDAWK